MLGFEATMPTADPITRPLRLQRRIRAQLREGMPILVRLLAVAVVVLLGMGITHALRSARLEVVLSADPAGPPPVGDPAFLRTTAALAEVPLSAGHEVRVLSNGSETYALLLADLAAAERSITVQMYYGAPGEVADAVLRTLADRARQGVLVRFMFDAVGTDGMPEGSAASSSPRVRGWPRSGPSAGAISAASATAPIPGPW
jgi:hypothetical protein